MREKDTVLEHLQHSALGAVLDDPHPLKIAEIVVQVHEPPGAILFREGGPADAIWVVCSGSLALDIQVPSRGAVTLSRSSSLSDVPSAIEPSSAGVSDALFRISANSSSL